MEAIKNATISYKIMTIVAEGMNVREAIDAVCGAGVSEQLIADLYNGLRAKAGK